MRAISMFSASVTGATTSSQSAVVTCNGAAVLAVGGAGTLSLSSGTLTVEVSWDGGTTFRTLQDATGAVALTNPALTYPFFCPGGLLRVAPSSIGGSPVIPKVVISGEVTQHTAPS